MPTANANTGKGFTGVISYAKQEMAKQKDIAQEQRAEVLQEHNIGGNTRDIAKQMREVAMERPTVQKPVLHIQINFHPDEKLTKEQANKAIDAVLKEIGVNKENNQYLVAQHKDKEHDHYHAVINRVGLDGSLVSNEKILDRLQVACDKVEQEQGLRRTEGRTIFYDPTQEKGFRYATSEEKADHRATKSRDKKTIISDKNEKVSYVKKDIQDRINDVLADKSVTTPEQFKERLESLDIDVKFTKQASGISGVSFKKDDVSIKGSAIDAKWGRVDQALTENSILAKENDLRAYIEVNSLKSPIAVHIVDQAIREKMAEIKPNQNVWATWEKNQNHEKLYRELHDYTEKLITARKEQKTAFDIAKQQREQKQEQKSEHRQEQEENQGQSNNPFDKIKAQREQKQEEEKERKRGRGR